MTLEEAIYKEEALAYSFGERYKRLGEPVGDLPELEAEHKQYAKWLKELQRYRFEISECKAILDNPTPDVTENDRKRAMYVLQTFPDVRGDER